MNRIVEFYGESVIDESVEWDRVTREGLAVSSGAPPETPYAFRRKTSAQALASSSLNYII